MKKLIPAALAVLLLTACGPKKEMNDSKMKEDNAKTVATVTMKEEPALPMGTIENGNLMGVHGEQAFNQEPFSNWFQPGYEAYEPDVMILDELTTQLQDVEIRAYMGTWCGDSKRETPKFYKLLDQAEYDQKNLTMITVDRSKSKPEALVSGYEITRVPTFIFYRDGKELGRFVEHPRESLEQDILKIVSGQPYKHSYDN
ncbi:thioredoxin family protein [Nonlabens antarcticus]|uniref:thioredoxin family protein n=1 Tax=Nonlabens antarcticus TaxID=392714 RepID=UPI00189178E5|nr:thioredoxin family protein [Nonlabens antarcticus]